jgi:hypothetical protein
MNGGALQAYTSGDRFAVNQNSFVNSSGVSAYVNTGYASQYLQLNSEHRFYTAPSGTAGNAITFTQAMTLTNSGQLLLGNTSSSYNMLVYGSTSAITQYGNSTTGNGASNGLTVGLNGSGQAIFVHQQAYPLLFGTGGSTTMTLDASGRQLVGLTSAVSSNKLQIATTTTAYATGGISLVTGNGASYIGTYGPRADINVLLSQNWKTNLQFLVNTSDSDTAPVEVGRFDSSGNLLVGTTSVISSGKISISAALYTTSAGITIQNTQTTYGSSTTFVDFINSGGSRAGNIYQSASTTVNYNTSSDSRLKQNIGVATDTSVIDNTIIHDFTWKADGRVDRGVFAQEAYEVKPSAVGVGKDDLTENGELLQPWSVDYSKYVPDLIVYCQQLNKRIQQLEAKGA